MSLGWSLRRLYDGEKHDQWLERRIQYMREVYSRAAAWEPPTPMA